MGGLLSQKLLREARGSPGAAPISDWISCCLSLSLLTASSPSVDIKGGGWAGSMDPQGQGPSRTPPPRDRTPTAGVVIQDTSMPQTSLAGGRRFLRNPGNDSCFNRTPRAHLASPAIRDPGIHGPLTLAPCPACLPWDSLSALAAVNRAGQTVPRYLNILPSGH